MPEIAINERMSVKDASAIINDPAVPTVTRRQMATLYCKARTAADKAAVLAKYPELANIFSEANHRSATAPAGGVPNAAQPGAATIPDGTVQP